MVEINSGNACDDLCIEGYIHANQGIIGRIAWKPVHPAYLHGYLNGMADKVGDPRKPAAEIRADFAYIKAVFADE